MPDAERILVYNYVSSCQRPITWETFRKHVHTHGSKLPGMKDARCMFWNSKLWVHKILMCLFHLLPAVMIDGAAILTGRDPRSSFLPLFFLFGYILRIVRAMSRRPSSNSQYFGTSERFARIHKNSYSARYNVSYILKFFRKLISDYQVVQDLQSDTCSSLGDVLLYDAAMVLRE